MTDAASEQRRSLDFRESWPARPGLRGLAAATNVVIDVGDLDHVIQIDAPSTVALEVFDFPPLLGAVDAHALWHAAT